jgi:hypothetical protein
MVLGEIMQLGPNINKYRKKPVVIEAIQWTALDTESEIAIEKWLGDSFESWVPSKPALLIGTKEGVMEASPGDWIIKGVKGEFYPCKPDIFQMTYEDV